MAKEERAPARPHAISLEGRKKALVTGVIGVDSFNERLIALSTSAGELTITGSALNISSLDLEQGRLGVEGDVDSLEYGGGKASGGLLGRLFK